MKQIPTSNKYALLLSLFALIVCTVLYSPVIEAQQKMYWTDGWPGARRIRCADLDGSNTEDLVTGVNSPSPYDIALDLANNQMYWTEVGGNPFAPSVHAKIQHANLDGSNVEDLITGLSGPTGVALDLTNSKMYWTDWSTANIQRANLDGSNREDLITGLGNPFGITLDLADSKMYWTDWGADKIQRANLDGSNVEDLVTTGLSGLRAIALDLTNSKMYWTDQDTAKIQRANLDGSNVEDLVTGLNQPQGIALDVTNSKMYWTDQGTGKIQRANLDGSNVVDLVTELLRPLFIALDVTLDVTVASKDVSPYAGSYTIMNQTTGTEIAVTVENGVRTIVANGLPNHETGAFPNAENPNSISVQDYNVTLPTQPELAAEPTSYNIPQPFGIATNGVHFDPFAAEWYLDDPNSGWQLAALENLLGFDEHNAHVQPSGAYHYHGAPMALLTRTDQPELIGFAGDGFPIYGPYGYTSPSDSTSAVVELTSSYQLKLGERPDGPLGAYDGTYIEDYEYIPSSGDLDECNGRTGVTPEYPNSTYYYVATLTWPFLGRCFAGSIADSFVNAGAPEGGGRHPPGRGFRLRPPGGRGRPPGGLQ